MSLSSDDATDRACQPDVENDQPTHSPIDGDVNVNVNVNVNDGAPSSQQKDAFLPCTESPATTKRKARQPKKTTSTVKTGVIYLSRVPPGLEPNALRSLLSPIGRTGRIWLRADNATNGNGETTSADNNNKQGWKRTTKFQDGWVEFVRLRDAKRAMDLLNGQPMHAGKKRGRFANDLWAMRLLPSYSWDDLGREVFGGSGRERVLKVREEVSTARREKAWMENRIELSAHIRKKRHAKGKGGGGVKRFMQTESAKGDGDSVEDGRAAQAAERVDREMEKGVGRKIDGGLLAKLFRNRG